MMWTELNTWFIHFVPVSFTFRIQVVTGQVPLKRPRVKVKCTDYAFKCRAGSRLGLLKQMLSWVPKRWEMTPRKHHYTTIRYYTLVISQHYGVNLPFNFVENLCSMMVWVTRYWVFVWYTSISEVQDPWYEKVARLATSPSRSHAEECLGEGLHRQVWPHDRFLWEDLQISCFLAVQMVRSQVSPLNRMRMYILYKSIQLKYLRKQLTPDFLVPRNALKWGILRICQILMLNQFQSNQLLGTRIKWLIMVDHANFPTFPWAKVDHSFGEPYTWKVGKKTCYDCYDC